MAGYWLVVAGIFVLASLVIAGALVVWTAGLLFITSLVVGVLTLPELEGGWLDVELVEPD